MIVGPPSSEKAYLNQRCKKVNDSVSVNMKDNNGESEMSSPSVVHDRVVVIWAVEVVCHLFPEVVHVICRNKKHLCEDSANCS